MELDTYMENAKNSCLATIKQLETAICVLQDKVDKCDTFPDSTSSVLTNLQHGIAKWLEVSNECITLIENTISELTLTVDWHPKDRKDMLEMFYLSGDSPWSFWLTYHNSSEIDSLIKRIELKWRNGALTKLRNPEVGSYVCCCENKVIFRGIVTSILSKSMARVLNIDKCVTKVIKLDSCYEMQWEFCEPHANAIQCCLTKEAFIDNKWNSDLTGLFQNVLSESRLTVRIIEKLDVVPSLFVVELYAFNESYGVETNVSHWFLNKLLRALRSLDDDVDKETLYTLLDDDILDPFTCIQDFEKLESDVNDVPNNVEKENSSEASLDHTESTVSSIISSIIDNHVQTKPRNRLAHLINPETGKVKPALGKLPSDVPKKTFQFESVLNVPEFMPINNSYPEIEKDLPMVTAVPALNGVCAEDTIMPANYTPKDDERICAFFNKNGYCWKPGCQKQHTKVVSDKWTDDSAEMFKEDINKIDLPSVGETVLVKVTNVICSNTFYAVLPEKYSETKDGCESIDSLIACLNDPATLKEMKMLSTPPCFGQLLIAYSLGKEKWLRGSVYDICDSNIIQVFFVDFGITEETTLDKCREILPQFIHLPYQAVYCNLSGIYAVNTQDEEGKAFLKSMILDQEIEVKVTDSDATDTRLDVIVLLEKGFDLNEMMVLHGFCEKCQR